VVEVAVEVFSRQLAADAERLALELGSGLERPLQFVASVSAEQFPAPARALARLAVPQLVRNAVAHGLERATYRRELGKPEIATVQLRLRSLPSGWHEIVVQDDGRGLDAEQLTRRGVALGVPAELLARPLELIFFSGFSTADSVSVHAGRGVGLDLVRAEVEALGGRVEVHTEPGAWCAVRLLVPVVSP
jgi:chemosensory pili system protein ChpA (sensor histidine kinase/response regulator)